MFDEEAKALPKPSLLLAAGDNVGASPPISALLEDMPTIDVENAWGLDATSFGNHEFDYGVARILKHEARANFPFLSANIVDASTNKEPAWIKPSYVFKVNGVRVGVIGATTKETPELVAAGNTAGLLFLDEAERIKRESDNLRRQGVDVQVVVIHEGASVGANPIGNTAGLALGRPHPRHRRRPGGVDGRPRDRRAHAPDRQHGDRRHPGGRGRQRGRQLHRRPAAGQER